MEKFSAVTMSLAVILLWFSNACGASSEHADQSVEASSCGSCCLLLQLGLLAIVSLTVIVQFREVERIHGVYSKRDFLYYPKYILVRIFLAVRQWRRPRRLWDSSPKVRFLERFGFIASEKENAVELPQQLHGKGWREEMSFSGMGSNSELLIVSIERRDDGSTYCDLFIQTSDGRKFHLPAYPKASSYATSAGKYQAGGLKFEDQEPMKRWRISFCGTLREASEGATDPKESQLVFAKFRFVWSALTHPFDYSKDRSARLLADSVAREPWSLELLQSLSTQTDDGYEQWGMLQGEINIPNQDPIKMILRGPRVHAWQQRLVKLQFHRSVVASVHMEDGTMLRLHGTSDVGGLTETWDKSYIVQNSLWLRPLKSLTLSLRDVGEIAVTSKATAEFSCEAGSRSYQVALKVEKEILFKTSSFPEDSTSSFMAVDCFVGPKRGKGIAVFSYREPDSSTDPDTQKVTTVRRQYSLPEWAVPESQRGLCVPFASAACTLTSLVGGKGASLAVLHRLRDDARSKGEENAFEMSDGFCVTVKAYQMQLEHSLELKESLEALQVLPLDESVLKEYCERVQKAFEITDLAPKIVSDIWASLLELFGKDWDKKSYALRSSAVGEDSDEASSAGQNETFLGITGLDKILKSVLSCWASQFSFRSVQYRRQNGVAVLSPMAVVVQEMVRADKAGVLFTCDPVTGDPACLHISANSGLGETVVSGEAEPDTIVLRRDEATGTIAIESVEVGQKGSLMRLDEHGILVKEEVSEDAAKASSISDTEALHLARVGVLVEGATGGYRDIEWAICQGKVYLLQSRPVTTVHGVTDFELMHEFDSAIICDDDYCTRGNTGEVLPGALTPLTLTSLTKALDCTIQTLASHLSKLTFRSADGYCAQNSLFRAVYVSHSTALLNYVELFMREHQDGQKVEPDKMAHCIGTFGRVFEELPDILRVADDRYKPMNKFQGLMRTFWFIYGLMKSGRQTKKAQDLSQAADFSLDEDPSAESIERCIENACQTIEKGGEMHIAVSGMSLFAEVMMVLVLNGDKKEVNMTAEQMSDIALLLGMHQDGVISREVPETFRELATLIRGTSKEEEFLQMTPKEADEWLRHQDGQLGYRYQEFFKRHGHRGLKEFEINCKPWGMTPELVAETLQTSVRIPVGNDKQSSRANAPTNPEDVVKSLKTELKAGQRRFLKFLVRLAARGVKQREATKSALVGLMHKLRLALVTVRRWLVTHGRIPDEDLTCFFTLYELLQLLQRHCPGTVQRALKRRRIYPTLDALQFPEVCKGVPRPLTLEEEQPDIDLSGDLEVHGTPVCHGKVTGPIRVVKSLESAKEIVPGDILITHSTDIGWSPYFPILGGLVTEIGGLISHGAVVAREYGLPCIVGVKNATKYFEPGDVGQLDGAKGVLIRISKSSPTS